MIDCIRKKVSFVSWAWGARETAATAELDSL